MHDGWFKLDSGRLVILKQFHVQASDCGFWEGGPEWFHTSMLTDLLEKIRMQHGHAILVQEPPPGPRPAFLFIACLHSHEPVGAGADFSDLVMCWFADDLGGNIPDIVMSRLQLVKWEQHAEDGYD
jgi:hypothetical protein